MVTLTPDASFAPTNVMDLSRLSNVAAVCARASRQPYAPVVDVYRACPRYVSRLSHGVEAANVCGVSHGQGPQVVDGPD